MKRPIESDFTSHVAYTRALEEYCDALAQEQEPVTWQFFQGGKWHNGMEVNDHRKHTEAAGVPVRDLYAIPPAAQRKPLTDEQIVEIYTKWEATKGTSSADLMRDVEAAHGIKEPNLRS